MILRNRIWTVTNVKMQGSPFKFRVKFNRQIGDICLTRFSIFNYEWFSLEELEDMVAILKKVKKETREDNL